ncbi:hypothetical protein EPUS_00284 [Endocarpon pusillum Z07020]|uniref:DUF8035 domain-containing protein n=1 Tax=Endocarpon pusillum (strain Z07020 / HMAS-L-300199) TaxID=1263415 RepID=U1FYV0_ENDPU|nr:uncharacterized protein EPUS_00284 [Endocarpon pusillum Z07020]ERF70097.1 hypothetical protein EPUS_00284 [Endocarpon pusillum Z07020]
MATYRSRGVSPPPRRFGEQRIPAAPVFSTAFDTRFSQQPRNTIDTLASSRPGAERVVDAQPISRRTYPASGHSAVQSKTEYAVRPRNNPRVGEDDRTPLRVLVPPTSPTRSRPLVDNPPHGRSRSPVTKHYYTTDQADRYIVPAISSPRQHRHQGRATPTDSSHLIPDGRERRERHGYRVAGSRVYPKSGALVRYEDENDYSYTTPREQFDRDYPPAERRPRRNSYVRQDRPTSTSDFDDWKVISQSRRETGPPPAVRQFDKLADGDLRHSTSLSGNYSDTERDLDKPRRRHSLRAPVSLHQNRRELLLNPQDERAAREVSHYPPKLYDDEPSYSSDRENYRPSSHYERHSQRAKAYGESRDRLGTSHGATAAGLGGLAAAGLASAIVKKPHDKDDDSDRGETRDIKNRYAHERDHRPEDFRKDRERIAERHRDRAAELRGEVAPREHRKEKASKERSDSDTIDDVHADGQRHSRKHRHHRRHSRPQELDSDSASDDGQGVKVPSEVQRERVGRDSAQEDSDSRREPRRSHPHRHVNHDGEEYNRSHGASEDGEAEEDRAARLQLVEPLAEKEPEHKPKGILKPARQVPFPEDPNPTREGVAPLKDAGKKGIPPGARWTKINRMLVNPAALEAAHERYEERDDYVIVLRVLSKEEIQKYADKTKEIREARELEWLERKERRRQKGGMRGSSDDSSDEERRLPLAIEAAPPTANPDPRYQQGFPLNTNSRPEPDPAAMAGISTRTQ